MNKLLIFFLSIIFFPLLVFSSSLESLVGSRYMNELLSKGFVSTGIEEGGFPVLVPENQYLKDIIEKQMDEVNPSVFVESLSIYKKPTYISFTSWTQEEKKALFNETLALSSLKGLEYFSKSKGKMRVLYEESDVIEDPENKKVIPDFVCPVVPDSMTVYVRQKDSTFGENIFRYDYYSRSDAFIFIQENLTSMKYGFLPLIGKNKLRSVVMVFDTGEHLLIYVISMAKASSVPWMEKRVKESFSNRIVALMEWFSARADAAYEKLKKE